MLTFEPDVEIRYLAKSNTCFAFLILCLSMMSLWTISSKYCCRRVLFFSSDFSRTTSGKPPKMRYSSKSALWLNKENYLNESGKIVSERFLPVNRLENSFERSEAEEPVTINFIFSSKSYFVLIHFSHDSIFCISSIKK